MACHVWIRKQSGSSPSLTFWSLARPRPQKQDILRRQRRTRGQYLSSLSRRSWRRHSVQVSPHLWPRMYQAVYWCCRARKGMLLFCSWFHFPIYWRGNYPARLSSLPPLAIDRPRRGCARARRGGDEEDATGYSWTTRPRSLAIIFQDWSAPWRTSWFEKQE